MQAKRQEFYQPERILLEVENKVGRVQAAGETIDYLTFVPDGEPTLDLNLEREIELLRSLGVRIAVISNASLIWHEDVRAALAKADWVSLKFDAAWEETWRKVARPHGSLELSRIFDGALEFARDFQGTLVTETMLVDGVNAAARQIRDVTAFLTRLGPASAYLSVPIRPPAEDWVLAPGEKAINEAYQILSKQLDHVECLIGYEGNAFAFTGNVEEDLLSITSVHPMREDAVDEFLSRARADWSTVDRSIARGKLIVTEYQGNRFYMRSIRRTQAQQSATRGDTV
jgi:wyosine [tRNA(Phe)-imidazoG37] synthetase (radical SAM superfamily)